MSYTPTQQCKVCKVTKNTATDFYKDRNRHTGYSNRCKACESIRTKERYARGHSTAPQEAENEVEATHRMAHTLRGKEMVQTPVGKADIVTEDAVYELKTPDNFKHAIGQLMAYNVWLKKPRMVLVLWGSPHHYDKGTIEQTCTALGIETMWEPVKNKPRYT